MFALSWFENPGVMFYLYLLGLVWCIILIAAATYYFLALHKRKIQSSIFNPRGKRRDLIIEAKMPERAQRFMQNQDPDANSLGWIDADASLAKNSPAAEDVSQVSGKGKTILIADDDPVVMFALSKRLQQLGFRVIRSPDAAHALMGAMKVRPDLVILDVNMPSGNGLAVCEMMASDPRFAGIPVVIHSVLSDEATKERCRKLGARHVEKSSKSWTEIKSLVETLLGKGGGEVGEEGSMMEPAGQPAEKTATSTDVSAANKPSDSASQHVVPVCGHARVLCIDSAEGELELVKNRLAALGVEVTSMHDLEEGFWACFTDKPHAVIIEIAGENKKVVETLHRFATHPLTKQFPVIFINHNNEIPAEELPVSAKFMAVGTPIAWKELIGKLENIIPIAGSQDEDPLAKAAPEGGESPPAVTQILSEPAVQSNANSARPLKILCIDDDLMIAKSLEVRTKPYDIEVKGAVNGTAGYLQAVSELPDVVLLDLQMPNGDGHYVLAKLKQHQRTKDIPVIMLTVETHPGVRRQMIGLGAAGFLSKPVRWKELFEELGRHVPLPKKLIDDYKLHEDQLVSV